LVLVGQVDRRVPYALAVHATGDAPEVVAATNDDRAIHALQRRTGGGLPLLDWSGSNILLADVLRFGSRWRRLIGDIGTFYLRILAGSGSLAFIGCRNGNRRDVLAGFALERD